MSKMFGNLSLFLQLNHSQYNDWKRTNAPKIAFFTQVNVEGSAHAFRKVSNGHIALPFISILTSRSTHFLGISACGEACLG